LESEEVDLIARGCGRVLLAVIAATYGRVIERDRVLRSCDVRSMPRTLVNDIQLPNAE
jgi:hypothetical protein